MWSIDANFCCVPELSKMLWEGAALVMENVARPKCRSLRNVAGHKCRSLSLCLPFNEPIATVSKTVSSDCWGRLVNMDNATKERSFEKSVLLLRLID